MRAWRIGSAVAAAVLGGCSADDGATAASAAGGGASGSSATGGGAKAAGGAAIAGAAGAFASGGKAGAGGATALAGSGGNAGSQGGKAGAGATGGGGAGAIGGGGAGAIGGGGVGAAGAAGKSAVPTTTVTFAAVDDELPNPERGFYDDVDVVAGGDFSFVRATGATLAWAGVRLDAYRTTALPSSLLDALDKGFADVRNAKIKVVLRFAYNAGFDPDEPLDRVLGHIAQLAPVLAKNADVVAVLQAGFVGAWGEWHSSTNGLTTPANEAKIVAALLAALPAERAIQLRTPMIKDAIYPQGPLSPAQAFDGSPRARVGHHDDCFLADESDMGTYADPIPTWKAYVAAESRFVPMGGETCQPNAPFSSCAPALATMTDLHTSFLNRLYHPDVLASWKPPMGACIDEIARKLGYRFVLSSATFPSAVAPGGEMSLTVAIENVGWAAPFNRRPVSVVLARGATRLVASLAKVDPRRWEGGQKASFTIKLRVPTTVAEGPWRLALSLGDAAATLHDVPEYAIRFANAGTWDAATGDNVLASALTIAAGAPGPTDPNAAVFAEIP